MGKQKRRAFLRNSVMAGLLAPVVGYWDDLVAGIDGIDNGGPHGDSTAHKS